MVRRVPRGEAPQSGDMGEVGVLTAVGREGSSVERIYDAMLRAIESSMDIRSVYEQYMPLFLSELETESLRYPYLKELFVETFMRLWDQWFPNINPPDIKPEEAVVMIQGKTFETLMENSAKLRLVGVGRASMTLEEREKEIRFLTLQFIHVVTKFVFKVMGVLR